MRSHMAYNMSNHRYHTNRDHEWIYSTILITIPQCMHATSISISIAKLSVNTFRAMHTCRSNSCMQHSMYDNAMRTDSVCQYTTTEYDDTARPMSIRNTIFTRVTRPNPFYSCTRMHARLWIYRVIVPYTSAENTGTRHDRIMKPGTQQQWNTGWLSLYFSA